MVASIEARTGEYLKPEEKAQLRALYDLDKPIYLRYTRWVINILKGDLGYSYQVNRPVSDILAERIPLTIVVSLASIMFSWVVAVPIGIYSAVRQYSVFDYLFTVRWALSAWPHLPFLLALVIMYDRLLLALTSVPWASFSSQFLDAPWSWPQAL